MKNFVLNALSAGGVLLVGIGVLAFANLFSGAGQKTVVPASADTGIFLIFIGVILFGLTAVIKIFLRNKF